jgi:Cd2+/Zn2+-exporting ATPase
LKNGSYQSVQPETVEIGDIIQVRSGEKVPLDGEMLSENSSFNTAALTAKASQKPLKKAKPCWPGCSIWIKVIELKVTKKYADSSLASILDMVQNATARKAKTELLIRRFAKIYTPIVFFLAVALVVVPYFVVEQLCVQ